MVICALKSPVREIATIEGTSIHQKTDKNLLQPLGKRARSMYKKRVFSAFAHFSSVDVGMLILLDKRVI